MTVDNSPEAIARRLAILNGAHDETASRETYLRCPFGYPGSKRTSLDHILPKIPYLRNYVEVFGGGGAVLLNRRKSVNEVFNDRHAGIVSFYRCIRNPDTLSKLADRLRLTIYSREEFIWCRDTWDKLTGTDVDTDIERAARWFYMVQMSFTNQGRNFARTMVGHSTVFNRVIHHIPNFMDVHNRIKEVLIENMDWRQMLKDFDGDDTVFYLDPPYLDVSHGIYEHEMSVADHREMCERIFSLKGCVCLSGYTNDLYDKYPWDEKYNWEVKDRMTSMAFTETNGKAGLRETTGRGKQIEYLWVKHES